VACLQAWFADYLIRDHDFDVEVRSKDLPGRKGQTGAEMVSGGVVAGGTL
jgi:hypothetical protein